MDGDDERTDKDSERSQPASPQNNSKTNTAIITDSSSGENGNQQRADGRRRKSRRNHRNNGKPFYREGRTRHKNNENNLSMEDSSVPAQRRKRRRRNNQRRPKYKPYTKLTWEERMERDEAESERATRRRANRPTPYNTTQFLMEDHKADTPDLSGLTENHDNDTSEEIFEEDFRNGEYLEKNFSAVYDEVQSERLESMSKEQLVNEVLALSKRVAELEESQQKGKGNQEEKCEGSREERSRDASLTNLNEKLIDGPYLKKEVEQDTAPELNS